MPRRKEFRQSQLQVCPSCGGEPFVHFLRGQVQRSRRWLGIFGFKRPYLAVICSFCKQIVGYEWGGPDA